VVFTTGQRTYLVGSASVDAQQSARFAIGRMVQDIRMAGYDPTGTASFSAVTGQGPMQLTLQYDWNGDGTISAANPVVGPDASVRGEQVVYAVSSGNLERRETGVDAAPAIVAPVSSLAFGYLDADGNPTAVAASIRTVVVTVTAPGGAGSTYTLGNVAVRMTDTVRLRNR
jgi:Tfp pilus assembly protein PilW